MSSQMVPFEFRKSRAPCPRVNHSIGPESENPVLDECSVPKPGSRPGEILDQKPIQKRARAVDQRCPRLNPESRRRWVPEIFFRRARGCESKSVPIGPQSKAFSLGRNRAPPVFTSDKPYPRAETGTQYSTRNAPGCF